MLREILDNLISCERGRGRILDTSCLERKEGESDSHHLARKTRVIRAYLASPEGAETLATMPRWCKDFLAL